MRFENQTFTGTTVTLDFNQFVNCTIADCLVVCHGGDFSLSRTTLMRCKFGVGGMANNTLQFLKLVRANGPQLLEDLLNQEPAIGPEQVTFN
ncbi:MAG TPA: hypothetical protein VFK87_10575 [Steroidobacteraceae bacterium]|nr:hypothetical protein [Steroidobacteraceae bacterium]